MERTHAAGSTRGSTGIGPVATLAMVVLMVCCSSPLDVDTPRDVVVVPATVPTDPNFLFGSGDSLMARVDGRPQVFATEVLRPEWHNGRFGDGYFVTVKATSWGLDGVEYEILSLRLDNVRDTGTFAINDAYSAPKEIDSLGPPRYGATYERRRQGFPEVYRSDSAHVGEVRVVRIDRDRGLLIGAFWFRAHCRELDTTITVDKGVFRLDLKP